MKAQVYNMTRKRTSILIKGFPRKTREEFKDKFKPVLKEHGLNLNKFYKKAISFAMRNPLKII